MKNIELISDGLVAWPIIVDQDSRSRRFNSIKINDYVLPFTFIAFAIAFGVPASAFLPILIYLN